MFPKWKKAKKLKSTNLKLKADIKDTKEIVEKFRPDKNSIRLNDGGELSWKVKPGKDKTKFGFELSKDFTEEDVEIMIKIGGEVNYFNSPQGVKDVIQSAEFSATKKF